MTLAVPAGYGPVLVHSRLGVADQSVTFTGRETVIGFTSVSASRTVTVSAVAPHGWPLVVKDEHGDCAVGRTITVTGNVRSAQVIDEPFGCVELYYDGGAWRPTVQAV